MIHRQISDWDDAYANGANIPGGDRWPAAWVEPARSFRESLSRVGRAKLDLVYGAGTRNHFDLFLPAETPKGLVVFVHGGFWLRFDKSFWSHLAGGPVASGYAVAMPSYTLCPQIRVAGIVKEIAAAVSEAAAMIEGPLMLAGHSAGGHLVTRMMSAPSPLDPRIAARIRHVVSISGIHDLRSIMNTAMNNQLHIDEMEALAESPALLRPVQNAHITCWVGGSERAEFVRQNALLANMWTGLGGSMAVVVEPDRHHFNVIDGLADPAHILTRSLLAA